LSPPHAPPLPATHTLSLHDALPICRRPPDDRKLRMLGTVAPGDMVVIFEEHLTVRADQHRPERLVPRPQGLGGQLHRTPQVPQVVIVHHVASVRSCSVPTPPPKAQTGSTVRFSGASDVSSVAREPRRVVHRSSKIR